jgi:hypothetical protein
VSRRTVPPSIVALTSSSVHSEQCKPVHSCTLTAKPANQVRIGHVCQDEGSPLLHVVECLRRSERISSPQREDGPPGDSEQPGQFRRSQLFHKPILMQTSCKSASDFGRRLNICRLLDTSGIRLEREVDSFLIFAKGIYCLFQTVGTRFRQWLRERPVLFQSASSAPDQWLQHNQ